MRTFWQTRWAPWALYLATVVAGVPLTVAVAWTNPPDPDRCQGIGWGCELSGWDLAFWAGYFYVLYLLVLAVVLGLVTLLPDRWADVRVGVAAVGLGLPWLLPVAAFGVGR